MCYTDITQHNETNKNGTGSRGWVESPHLETTTTEGKMKISELATKELKPGRTLKASSWRAERVDSETRNIYHYSTLMAVVTCGELYQKSEGWGSVSDKRGLSQLRRALAK